MEETAQYFRNLVSKLHDSSPGARSSISKTEEKDDESGESNVSSTYRMDAGSFPVLDSGSIPNPTQTILTAFRNPSSHKNGAHLGLAQIWRCVRKGAESSMRRRREGESDQQKPGRWRWRMWRKFPVTAAALMSRDCEIPMICCKSVICREGGRVVLFVCSRNETSDRLTRQFTRTPKRAINTPREPLCGVFIVECNVTPKSGLDEFACSP